MAVGKRAWLVSALVAATIAATQTTIAQERPQLRTNEAYLNEVTRATKLAIDDPMAVFDWIFASLPDRVKVYPTENYYYFTFVHGGVGYSGNIRLELDERGGMTAHFYYGEDLSLARDDVPSWHLVLDQSKEVTLEKLERLIYRMTFHGKSVAFALNDLSQVKPPETALGPDEKFIGPIFDESGIRFFLVFNSKLKIFHYVLDETVEVADQFYPSGRGGRILVGKRSGFAFYRDHQRDRKILIGVSLFNVLVNNYFDGPFDQLPDNFIEGEELRDAILKVDPSLRGKIDRFGSEPSGETRFMIDPYLPYQQLSDLDFIDRCAVARVRAATYYKCLSVDDRVKASIFGGGPRGNRPRNGRKSGRP